MTPLIDAPPRVLIRVVKSPHEERGELLVVYVDSRTISDPAVVVYSVTQNAFRVEAHHRHLMWRTRRASLNERAVAAEALAQMGWEIRILQAAPRAVDDPDEAPVLSPVEKRRAMKTGYITCKR